MGRPQKWDYEFIARLYNDALTENKWPTKRISELLHIHKSHAAKLVATARRKGFLEPTTKGAVPGFTPKNDRLRRVADRIGITQTDLRQILIDEAQGALRVTIR